VTGGVNEENVGELVVAGLRHFVVVRASPKPKSRSRGATDPRRPGRGAVSVPVEPT